MTVAVLLMVWLCGCSGSSAEVMADSVSGNTAQEAGDVADNHVGDDGGISGNTAGDHGGVAENSAAAGDGIADNNVVASDGISENSASVSGGISGNDMAGSDGEDKGESVDMRPAPVKVKGIYVSGPVAGTAKMDDLIDLVARTELNAMVIDIKNDEGKVTYKMQTDQVAEFESGVRYIPDIKELVDKCKEKDIYLIARIVAFRDPYLPEKKPEWAVHTKDGKIFRDKKGLAWVNPYQREMWDYLAEIAAQAGADGFDEVQFDYIRFSTGIGEEEVDYGPEADQVGKVEIITEFTKYMYDKLVPQGIYVAADVFGTVIDNETDQKIVGQDYAKMAEHLDYICPMVYPSHYRNGAYGIKVPDAEPYVTIYAAASSSVEALAAVPEEKRAHVRMWLQSFTAGWVSGHISYGPQQIREQIKGAYDAGYEEWILWNAAVNYQPEAFLTEEKAEEERLRWEEEKAAAERLRQEETEAETARIPGEEAEAETVRIPGEEEAAETVRISGEEAEAETARILVEEEKSGGTSGKPDTTE